jgi:hypothetical protein
MARPASPHLPSTYVLGYLCFVAEAAGLGGGSGRLTHCTDDRNVARSFDRFQYVLRGRAGEGPRLPTDLWQCNAGQESRNKCYISSRLSHPWNFALSSSTCW